MNNSNQKPEKIQQLGQSLYAFNYNIEEIEEGYQYDTLIFAHVPKYDEVVNRIIQGKYPNGAELAIQRKGILDRYDDDFVSYNDFVEQTKADIKPLFDDEVLDPSDWSFHEDFQYRVKAKKTDFLVLVEAVPEFAVYRKEKPINVYYFEDYVIFYVNRFEEGHRELLEMYLGVNSIKEKAA